MEISEKQLNRFAEIYREETGNSDVSKSELRSKAEKLLLLVDTIYQPIESE